MKDETGLGAVGQTTTKMRLSKDVGSRIKMN